MNRRKLCSLSMAFLLGIAAAEYGMPLLWCVFALSAAAWIAAVAKDNKMLLRVKIFWVAAFFGAALFGWADGCQRQMFLTMLERVQKDGQSCLVQGEIYRKEKDEEKNLFYLKNCRMKSDAGAVSCHQILLYLKAESYSVGEILCVKGNIKTFRLPANEGNYHERSYYQSLDISFAVEDGEVLFVSGKANKWREWLGCVKQKMEASYKNAMPEKDAGVLTAMTLGDKGQMDLARKEMYRNAGISHFYSISGLHISMLGMALYHFLRKRGKSYLFAGVVSAAVLIAYGEMIGFGISASRAIGMFLVLLYAKYRGRSYDQATSLALMAAILVGKHPGLLHHAGFLLSFGAVGGVLLAGQFSGDVELDSGEKDRTGIRKKICAALRGVRETCLVSVCIQCVTTPVLCQNFYEISVYAPLVNLVVLPCMGGLLGLGILGGVLGCFFPLAGKVILFPCYCILLIFDRVCSFSLQLPCATLITGALPAVSVLLWYVLLAAAVVTRRKMRNAAMAKLFSGVKIVLLFFCFGFILLMRKTPGFEMDFLDVGQGDGIYLSTGDGTDIFIDGGSSDIRKVGVYRIVPFLKYKGVRKIDYWFVSHCDADHISGLGEALESGYQIGYLVVSKYIPEDEAWQELRALARKHRVEVLWMDTADALRGEGWGLECLWPVSESVSGDRNQQSLALLFEGSGCRAFFAGDIGQEEERKLMQKRKLSGAEIYKASHHGSNSSNSRELLEVLRPEIAVVSCSLHNRYGHPGKEASKRLGECCARIYETRTCGQIKIKGVHLEDEVVSMLE